MWEHKYYFIGKVWMHQQSLTWQQCAEVCCIVCVRAESINGLVSYHNECGPCGELFTVCKKMRRSWVWTGEKGNAATSRILWVYVKQLWQHQEVIRSLGTSKSKALMERWRNQIYRHSSLLTGRSLLIYSSASPSESRRGAERKRNFW